MCASVEMCLENLTVAACAPKMMLNKEKAKTATVFASVDIHLKNPAAAACAPQKEGIVFKKKEGGSRAAWNLIWLGSGWWGSSCVFRIAGSEAEAS